MGASMADPATRTLSTCGAMVMRTASVSAGETVCGGETGSGDHHAHAVRIGHTQHEARRRRPVAACATTPTRFTAETCAPAMAAPGRVKHRAAQFGRAGGAKGQDEKEDQA